MHVRLCGNRRGDGGCLVIKCYQAPRASQPGTACGHTACPDAWGGAGTQAVSDVRPSLTPSRVTCPCRSRESEFWRMMTRLWGAEELQACVRGRPRLCFWWPGVARDPRCLPQVPLTVLVWRLRQRNPSSEPFENKVNVLKVRGARLSGLRCPSVKQPTHWLPKAASVWLPQFPPGSPGQLLRWGPAGLWAEAFHNQAQLPILWPKTYL